MAEVGDTRPVLYYHGMTDRNTPTLKPEVIGKATVSKIDEKGVWFDVVLDKLNKKAQAIYEAVKKGLARASSAAAGHLIRKIKETGEIIAWGLAELSVWDWDGTKEHSPANHGALVRLPMKALYESADIEMPENFVKSGELETELVQEEECDHKRKLITIRIIK
jgi:hypothetical protein